MNAIYLRLRRAKSASRHIVINASYLVGRNEELQLEVGNIALEVTDLIFEPLRILRTDHVISNRGLQNLIEDGSLSAQDEGEHAICVYLEFIVSVLLGAAEEAQHRHDQKVKTGLGKQQLSLSQTVYIVNQHVEQRLEIFAEVGLPPVQLFMACQ